MAATPSSSRSLRPRKTPIKEENQQDDLISDSNSKGKSKRNPPKAKQSASASASAKKAKRTVLDPDCKFEGPPIPDEEARNRWPRRYKAEVTKISNSAGGRRNGADDEEEDEVLLAKCHYQHAVVDDCVYDIGSDVFVKANKGEPHYIGRIVEFFRTTDDRMFFTAQWFFRAEDTVIEKMHARLVEKKRLFLSDLQNDNPLDCIVSKLKIERVPPNVNLKAKEATIPSCDFYYDMKYSLDYTAFSNLPGEIGSKTSSTISSEAGSEGTVSETKSDHASSSVKSQKSEMTLLDLYAGCGGMSTGLCLGALASGVNLVNRWAVDFNEFACDSLRMNHRETQVINDTADNFLTLLKEWQKLCQKYSLVGTDHSRTQYASQPMDEDDGHCCPKTEPEELEVQKLVDVRYGDPNGTKEVGLYFKVRWAGYGASDDTWEPISGLHNCQERIQDFVTRGYQNNILPLPGDVDVICGGPPCQGVSGFNRHRNVESPLDDEKNYQLVVFMDIVEYLQPRFVLMENVVDILKFADGYLGRYAIARLVSLNYQTRLGMMVAGCYGLAQFRMRCFFWGARPTENLPQYPMPTHEVVIRGQIPNKFERNVVAYVEGHPFRLKDPLTLGDTISDMPAVRNDESRDEIQYESTPQSEFQKYIRLSKDELVHMRVSSERPKATELLYDHRPLQLNKDDYDRVCLIPKNKNANFRDLPGVMVGPGNKVERDPSVKEVFLESGKPLIPKYAMTFCDGSSSKPFGRLWWDEIVPTVVTRAEPHNQVIIHPVQDRVLTVRENARLQGFPDYYKLSGPVKERYIQVGNAVAVPVGRALGYALGLACQGIHSDEPTVVLPSIFSNFVAEGAAPNGGEDVESVE